VTGFAADSSMFEVGMSITGAGVSPSTWILARVSGKGGEGTYTVSVRQNVAETEIKGEFCFAAKGKASISGTTLTVTGFAAESSMVEVGMNITGAGVSPSTWILERVSGKGGEGTYTVSVRQNVAETEIKGEFYLMNSVYTLMLQQFVIWWYWKDIMEFSEQMLVWLGADFDYLKGLRPIMIISVVIVFDSTFVFTKGLGHFVTIVDTVSPAATVAVHQHHHPFK
jgi:hypothetical protein